MNPDLEVFILPVIELHKKESSHRIDWSYVHRKISGLKKENKDELRMGMIDMGIIKSHPESQPLYTILIKYDFDLELYKKEKNQEKEKKWYETENARLQYVSFKKVECRAKWAIRISIISIVVYILVELIKQIGQ